MRKAKFKVGVPAEQAQSVIEQIAAGGYPAGTVSLSDFLKENMEVLISSGESVQSLRKKFLERGVDVGCYSTFNSIYKQARTEFEMEQKRGADE